MKKIYSLIAGLMLTASIFAQAPQKMSYQAIIRNSTDNLVTNQSVGMQISILQGGANGFLVYVETQNPTSNINGLITLEIGTGITTDDFSTIDWTNGIYFIKAETDPAGGSNYTITGTSQLMSVPYALHANTADNFTGTLNETDPIFGASIASAITATDTANWNNTTDTQIDSSGIALLGYVAGTHMADTDTHIDSLGLVALGFNAGGIIAETDGSVTNEIQILSKTGSIVSLSNGGGNFIDAVDDNDNDPINELQTLSKTLNIVTLSNTGGSFSVDDADADPLNELQDISLSGSDLTLSNGSTIDLSAIGFDGDYNNLSNTPTNISVFNNDENYLTSEIDPIYSVSVASAITSTLVNNWSIAYSWGNHANEGYLTSFTEVDASVTNEIQTLSLSGNDLTISGTGGNTITLPSSSAPSYTIGLNIAMGGYIFYVTPDGKHGLVVSTQNQSTSANWYEAKDVATNPANHNADGMKFTNWRLPAKWEINLLVGQQVAIGGFSNFYWTGTEDDATRAWAKSFSAGVDGNAVKTTSFNVRAVRSF